MINIIINNHPYPAPTKWEELNLKQAQLLIAFLQDYTKHQKTNRNSLQNSVVELLANLCHIPPHITQKTYPHERLELILRIVQALEENSPQSANNTVHRQTNSPTSHPQTSIRITSLIKKSREIVQKLFLHHIWRLRGKRRPPKQQQLPRIPNLSNHKTHLTRKACKQTIQALLRRHHWHSPATGTDINGAPLPLHKITAEAFCEASDLYRTDAWGYAPWILALLDSKSSHTVPAEKRLKQKAQQFQTISAISALNIFDLLQQTHATLKKLFPCCYASPLNSPSQTSLQSAFSQTSYPVSWVDMLHFAAGYIPSELGTVRRMPLYAFMQLLNAKCKQA